MAMTTAGENYISGDMSGLMNQFSAFGRQIAKGRKSGYTPEEISRIRDVYRPSSQALEVLGRGALNIGQGMGRANLVPGLAGSGAYYFGNLLGGPLGGGAAVLGQQALGYVAKKAAIARTRTAAENAIRTVLAGKGAQSAIVQKRIDDLTRLLAAQGINLNISANR